MGDEASACKIDPTVFILLSPSLTPSSAHLGLGEMDRRRVRSSATANSCLTLMFVLLLIVIIVVITVLWGEVSAFHFFDVLGGRVH